jgi:hypothetical protein
MAQSRSTVGRKLRIFREDVKARLVGGEALTVLDVRGEKAWESSGEKIRGAIRVSPEHFRVDPAWPKDRLTVAYCT